MNKLVKQLNDLGASITCEAPCPPERHSPKVHMDLGLPIKVGGTLINPEKRSSDPRPYWAVYPAHWRGGTNYEEFNRFTDAMNHAVQIELNRVRGGK